MLCLNNRRENLLPLPLTDIVTVFNRIANGDYALRFTDEDVPVRDFVLNCLVRRASLTQKSENMCY